MNPTLIRTFLIQLNELLRFMDRQHSQKHLVHQRKYGSVRADSEGEGGYGDGREHGSLAEGSEGETEILGQLAHRLHLEMHIARQLPRLAIASA
jgi:hypothetical protein